MRSRQKTRGRVFKSGAKNAIGDNPKQPSCSIDSKGGDVPESLGARSHAMLLVGVLWVLPMLALALLFSDGDELEETG